MLSRRSLIIQLSTTALVGALATRVPSAVAADKTVKIGINLPFTGADAHDAELIKDGALLAIDEANAQGRGRRLQARGPAARRRHRDRRAVRSGAGGDECPQNGRRQGCRRGDRSADERLRQGDVADLEPRRPGDNHPELDQPRHHRSEIRRPISAQRQGDLFPHRDDRRLPGAEHGQLLRRYAQGEIGLYPRRQRRLWRRHRRHLSRPRPKSAASRCSVTTSSIPRRPTTRRP